MQIDKHLPGQPAQFVLRSPGLAGLTDFYTGLFGWTGDVDRPEGTVLLGDRGVGRLAAGEGGWLPFLAVQDLTQAVQTATEAGATLLEAPAGDVDPDLGACAVVLDPTGTPLGLAEAGGGGVEVMAEDGAVVWVEQKTHDQQRATAFLTAVFGYGFVGPEGPGKVRVARTEGTMFGGVMEFDDRWAPDETPHWLVYLQVSDVAATLDRAVALGGSVWFPPFDTPLGEMAYVRDPEGNAFAVVHVSAQGAAMTGGAA